MLLSPYGVIVQEEWLKSPSIRSEILLDEFVIMPNHIHGIVLITDEPTGATGRSHSQNQSEPTGATSQSPLLKRRRPRGPAQKSLSSFIAGFKAITTKRINVARSTTGKSLWQRDYYEHIIRGPKSLAVIQNYIATNVQQWALDNENPHRTGEDKFKHWLESQSGRPVPLYGIPKNGTGCPY